MPLLVELPVSGQVGLGGDTAHPPALDDQGAVVEAVAQAQGGADDEGGQEVGAGGAQGLDGGEHVGQQDVGQEEVVDGVAGQAQLGEGGQADAVVGQGAGLLDDGGGVGGRVDGHHRQGDGGDAGEALVVGGEELDVGRWSSHGGVGVIGVIHGVGHGLILPSTAPSRETAALMSRPGHSMRAGAAALPPHASMTPTQQHAAPTRSPVEPGATRRAQPITHAWTRGAAWNRWRQGRACVRRKRVTERRQERSIEESEETAITFLSTRPKTSTSSADVGSRESGTGRVTEALKVSGGLSRPGPVGSDPPGQAENSQYWQYWAGAGSSSMRHHAAT